MAKKNQVYIDIIVDDDGTTKRVAVDAKKLGAELDRTSKNTDRAAKGQDRLNRTSKDLDRNMRGAAKMTSNSTKEFSKMRQGMGGLVGTYATLAAQVFAVTAAFQFLQTASDYRNLISGQEALGAVTGTAYKTITNSIIEATDAQIKYADAAKAAAIGSAAGLTSTQLTKLGEVAKNASFALGRDLTDSFNRLVRGVTKAEPELLDELGIILRLENASEKYATKLGIAASELTAFQRTQAVANDVLEQGERKYAAIQAMMSEDAAALQQFSKSFDDLANTFRKMVIDGLTPVLKFLTDNTEAFVASLTLFALPIIRAIIPSIHTWNEESKLLFAQHKADHERYVARAQQQSAVLKTLTNDHRALKKAAEEVATARGKDVTKGGIGFVSGHAHSPQAKAAAKKGLKIAEDDLRKHTRVMTGIFKGWKAEEVAIARAAYNVRAGLAERHTIHMKRQYDTMATHASIAFSKILASFTSMQIAMRAVAAAGMKIVGATLALATFAGTLGLISGAYKSIMAWLKPIGEEAERQLEILGKLGDRYEALGEELTKARGAREKLTTGSMDAVNIGNVLQSADIGRVVEDLQVLASSTDRTSDKFKNLNERLYTVTGELARVNKAFKPLLAMYDQAARGTPVDISMLQNMLKVADKLMEVGNTIVRLPEIMQRADKAFNDLSSSMIKANPLDNYLQQERIYLEGLKMQIAETEKKQGEYNRVSNEQETKRKQQEHIDNKIISRMKTAGLRQMAAEFEAANEAQRARMRGIWVTTRDRYKNKGEFYTGGTTIEGRWSKPELEALKKGKKITDDIFEADKKEQSHRLWRHGQLLELRNQQVEAATESLRIEKDLTSQQVRGVTIQGRMQNLSLQRFKNTEKVRLAEEALARAEKAKATQSKNAAPELQEAARVNVENAEATLNLEKARKRLADDRIAQTEEQIALEKDLLAELIAQYNAQARARGAKLDITREQLLGGGTGESLRNIRTATRAELLAKIDAQQAEVDKQVKIYNKERNVAINNLLRLDQGPMGDLARSTDATRAAEGKGPRDYSAYPGVKSAFGDAASMEPTILALEQAWAQAGHLLDILNLQLEAHDKIKETWQESLVASQEQAQLQLNAFSVLKEHEAVMVRVLELRQKGIPVTEDEIDAAKKLATETERLLQKKKNAEDLRETTRKGFENMFEGLITGAKTAKEAFADFFKSVLAGIAKIIARNLAIKAMSFIPGSFFTAFAEKGGIMPAYASGGYTSPKRRYGRGGMARGPQSGYNAVLHGNEAVVPLPDNRHIPVDIQGGAGQQNIVTVNVSMDNSGNNSDSSSNNQMGANIGKVIAQAVQEELQYQKRSGGILNPYGVA